MHCEHVDTIDALQLKVDILQSEYDDLKLNASIPECDNCALHDLELVSLKERCDNLTKAFEKLNVTSLSLEK